MSTAAENTEPETIPSGGDRLVQYLSASHTGYKLHRHRAAFTATEVAASEHVAGARFAKVVIVVADDRLQMVVLPATSRVDLEAAARALGAAKLRLAHEEEFAGVFPDCEPGAMPAFGNLYGLPVWVDELMAGDESISMNAGSHGLSLTVRYRDFARLAQPRVARFHRTITVQPPVSVSAASPRRAAVPGRALERLGQALEDVSVLPALAPGDVYDALSSHSSGLEAAEADERLMTFGPNLIQEVHGHRFLRQLARQFIHLFALLLWAGAGLALLAGLPHLAEAIVAVIVINGVFGLWQEHRAESAVAALKKLLPDAASVIRDGVELRLPADRLVPGDVLLLGEGDRLSADARLVETMDLRLDESTLTGESHPVHKMELPLPDQRLPILQASNMVFAGTTVVAGSGRAVVANTGMRREFGKIAQLTAAVRQGASPLEREVASVARRVAALSVIMGGLFFAIGYWFAGLSLMDGAVFAIGIVLGNVPEGLLPTMTLSLAIGVQRMAKRQAIVKRLAAVETLGACTVICTDKTGTLTRNELTVRQLWTPGRQHANLTGSGYDVAGYLERAGQELSGAACIPFLPLLRIGSLCNAARLYSGSGPEGCHVAGDPTEAALLVAAVKVGIDREAELRLRPLVRQLAFDSVRKRMSTIHRALSTEGPLVAYVKGAPLELLQHCSRALVAGREVPLGPELLAEATQANDRLAQTGMRVLAMAYRYLPPEDEALLSDLAPGEVEQDMVFAGLAGMQDAPREEVAAAVSKCRSAGIRVVMITGDYGLTAESVARQVGILPETSAASVVEGRDLEAMTDEQLQAILHAGQPIFARATPEHKLRIVTTLQQMGEVVAVTGDGVNDAPALKKADIGVAMGVCGTDVAREAAEMVLADDNFATIVIAIQEGRAIFDNMRKFIVYIFAHLSPEALPYVLFAVFRVPLPLTVMQILAIDLGTETMPALALGVERPEPDVMSRPPRRRSERLLDMPALLRGYGFLGLMSTAVVLGGFFTFLLRLGWTWQGGAALPAHAAAAASTVTFLGIVVMQVGNAFACRAERTSAFSVGLLSNHLLLAGIGFELVFAAALIYVPFAQPLFGTAAVSPLWWAVLSVCVVPVFLLEEVRKWIVRRRVNSRRPGMSD